MNTQITEDYVSFEVAKLLKEKGFDEVCWRYWSVSENEIYGTDGIPFQNHELDDDMLAAPTLQMAMKWLREVHNICISVDVKIGGGKYYVCISSTENGLSHDVLEDEVWDTFEEACEKAIKYCLTNLI